MLKAETIRKVGLSGNRDGKSIPQPAKDLRLSRNRIVKAIRSKETSFQYKQKYQPRPKAWSFVESLKRQLEEDEMPPKRNRRTAQIHRASGGRI